MPRLPALAVLAGALLLAGCGGGAKKAAAPAQTAPKASAKQQLVRDWSAAINRGDDTRAAGLFAPPATIEQAGLQYVLESADAVYAFNHGLPCAGRIVELRERPGEVVAVFVLGERPGHRCDAPGARVAAVFTIAGGKIVGWRQIDPDAPDPGSIGPAA